MRCINVPYSKKSKGGNSRGTHTPPEFMCNQPDTYVLRVFECRGGRGT